MNRGPSQQGRMSPGMGTDLGWDHTDPVPGWPHAFFDKPCKSLKVVDGSDGAITWAHESCGEDKNTEQATRCKISSVAGVLSVHGEGGGRNERELWTAKV